MCLKKNFKPIFHFKHCTCFCLLLFHCAFSEATMSPVIFNITGGVSKALGEGSQDVNLGSNFGAGILGQLHKNIALGGSVAVNKWNFDIPDELEIDASISILEVLALLRFTKYEDGLASIFAQLGIGYFPGSAKVSGYGFAESNSETKYGTYIGIGMNVKKVLVLTSLKNVSFDKHSSTRWLSFTIGVNIFG